MSVFEIMSEGFSVSCLEIMSEGFSVSCLEMMSEIARHACTGDVCRGNEPLALCRNNARERVQNAPIRA